MRKPDACYMIPHQNGNNHGENNGPVTVIATSKAKKGKIKEFEEWMDGIIHEAMKFEGHMGVNIIRPTDLSNPEYVIIFRFNTYENLIKWEKSEIRKEWLKKSKDVTEGEPTIERQSGLEFWFTPNSGNASAGAFVPPPRYKMAIVTGGIIFVMLNTLLPLMQYATAGLPVLLGALMVVVIMVLLMTYVIMPAVTWVLRPWLSKKKLF